MTNFAQEARDAARDARTAIGGVMTRLDDYFNAAVTDAYARHTLETAFPKDAVERYLAEVEAFVSTPQSGAKALEPIKTTRDTMFQALGQWNAAVSKQARADIGSLGGTKTPDGGAAADACDRVMDGQTILYNHLDIAFRKAGAHAAVPANHLPSAPNPTIVIMNP
ncbi:MAG: hypothetical protein EB060_04645 [Proteobacteria bacterium]|nr:hypothetical protein [Pseudomonadota bacterium]